MKEDAQVLRPTPSGPMRAVDTQIARGKVAKERTSEKAKTEAVKIAHEFKARQQKSHDHDRDRER